MNLIENNSERYKVYSIGIWDNFDEDLIKNAGIIGKGHYNFCQDIKKLNEIIASEVSRASRPIILNFSIKSNLDPINLCLNYGKIDNNELSIKKNEAIYFYYMIQSNIINKDNNNDGNNINNNNIINLDINYVNEDNKKINEKYEITPFELPIGEIWLN